MSARRPPCRFCGRRDGDLVADEPIVKRGWCGSPTRTFVSRRHEACWAEFERVEAEAAVKRRRLYEASREARRAGRLMAAAELWERAEDVRVESPVYPEPERIGAA